MKIATVKVRNRTLVDARDLAASMRLQAATVTAGLSERDAKLVAGVVNVLAESVDVLAE